MPSKQVIEKLQKPCTVIIKHDGKKVFKKVYPMASDMLLDFRVSLDHQVTTKLAKAIYK